jgi:hypothetical protein
MNTIVPVSKDENSQAPVPTAWRTTFSEIVEAFIEGDFCLARGVSGVRQISQNDAKRIQKNIRDYGVKLVSLPNDTWKTSVCQWMCDYWDVYVDLFTAEEGSSDLVLDVRVYEDSDTYIFDVQSVHVP